ncbi:NAD-dependent succinate-semialdehyde dehydrogenase [Lampropedia puyangensis]|uniref:NAD-dependent succinate-semialdehyde dehydrogenase n=1 Tax=Lampropedia puyangensis TaxID=1330072 RepID=A0A4V4GR07_9BURK|nr:NAD-dependent succinate-semialdehyde dehydrogenase [Lampropedia puyangensis]THU00306.1 NAD-dependent succinate-semialdehyde dehydrogenase [Lampropedia puyangensis]
MVFRYPDTRLLINNVWRDAADGRTQDVFNPATGLVVGKVAHASTADLDEALIAAQNGFEVWRTTSSVERQRIMREAASLLRQRADDIARIMTIEQGKPVAEAKVEVLNCANMTEWFADEGRRVYGRIVPGANTASHQMVIKQPIGPVAAFTPWNFPLNQVTRKLGPALATGCSFLCKAPEETPASPAAFLQCFVDAGIPEGVIGLVYGNPADISEYLIASPVIRFVTFTGSTPVGKQLAAKAGEHMKKVVMELGGHAPVIVAEDADVDLAVKAIGMAKYRNAGQICIAPTRFLVHESLTKAFQNAYVSYSESLKVGDGLAADTKIGPLANDRRLSAMEKIIADIKVKGGDIVTGGYRVGDVGNFFAPTLVVEPAKDSMLFNEEPFGPIAGLRSFKQLDEAINEANRLSFGLSAYAFTRSFKNVHTLADRVETGMLWINQPATPSAEFPFGGVKDSGLGTEGGHEALEEHLISKAVAITGI